MFSLLDRDKNVKKEDDDTFAKRIRGVIEDHSGYTSGIKVFEHEDDSALDDNETKILENLRNAHEKWKAEHGDTSDVSEDTYKSVRVYVA